MSSGGAGPTGPQEAPRWNGLKRTPLKRFTRLRRFSPKRRAAERKLAESKVIVIERSEGRCEATKLDHECMGAATQFHHVEMRSSGGGHDPENLLHVCTRAHLTIHKFPRDAEALGYIRRRVRA